ncbi:MAG: hemolysin III family protein [Rectinemataceae bacterium]|nr:hemolysin III family protein [Rectinemataceae bacterium]
MKFEFREPFNSISHLVGAALALPASLILMLKGGASAASGTSAAPSIALATYGLSLFTLFAASGIYHASMGSPKALARLRQFDHAAIYTLIAGTYTPFCLIAFSGFWKWGLLAIIWTLAFAGVVATLFIMGLPRAVTAGIYVGMGWLSVFAVREFMAKLSPSSLGWLLAGGLLYTGGAVVYATKKGHFFSGRLGFHEIWHIFVLLAAIAHFISVSSLL